MSIRQRKAWLEYRKLVQHIQEEFEDIPRLRVTVPEAARFWAIDEITCESVLTQLAATGFLARGADSRFEMYQRV